MTIDSTNPYAPPEFPSEGLVDDSPDAFPLTAAQTLAYGFGCSVVSGLIVLAFQLLIQAGPRGGSWREVLQSMTFGTSALTILFLFGWWLPKRNRSINVVLMGFTSPVALFGYYVWDQIWLHRIDTSYRTYVAILCMTLSFATMLVLILWANRYRVSVARALLSVIIAPILWIGFAMAGLYLWDSTWGRVQDWNGYSTVNVAWSWAVTAQIAIAASGRQSREESGEGDAVGMQWVDSTTEDF